MRRPTQLVIPALAAAALAGCGSSSKSSSSASTQASAPAASSEASSAVVKSASNAKLGATVLVDGHGMTLYTLSGEASGHFICSSAACTQVWHPLTGSTASVSIASLGEVKRPDGSEQVAYKGMPLYTFAQDSAPGEANGQGIRDIGKWGAVKLSAASAGSASESSATTTSTSSAAPPTTTTTKKEGGGYAY
jgi:predicted lipoprotein with Yx(FWY)xxD motif